MKKINRRGFLKTGIAGTAGLALTPVAVAGISGAQQKDIIYRTLGKTGLKIPVVSFGVMRSDNPGLCKAAYEKGIMLFDTANGYQNGNNETMLGNLLKDYPRESFYLATKVKSAGMSREGLPGPETTEEDFLSKFATSLSRLQMKYVDILYVHDVSNPEYLLHKPVLNAVKKLKKEGKVRFAGFSTHKNEPVVIDAAASRGEWDVILTSYNFKQDYHKELDAAIHKAAGAGIGIVAMKTLAGGGFMDKEKTKPVNTTAAIKWVLSNPDITTTIPGMTQFEHLDLNAAILSDLVLSEKEKQDILIASNEPGLFCSGCKECLPECRNKLFIPDLMRAYMYAYGYNNPAQARDLLVELGYGNNPCNECSGECTVKCSRNFRVMDKISDVSRLVNVPEEFLV